jgi:hypothetical protein
LSGPQAWSGLAIDLEGSVERRFRLADLAIDLLGDRDDWAPRQRRDGARDELYTEEKICVV